MQVKIFKEHSHTALETRVNLWLETYGDSIKIIKILQTPAGSVVVITILYNV
jgi:hypothetical protein